MFTPEVKLGPDAATARLNSGGEAMKAMEADRADEAKDAATQYREQATAKLQRLGVATLYSDLPPSNEVLIAALAKIKAAGAIDPIVERVTVANQGGNWEFELYHFPKFLSPGIRYSAEETLMALSPDSVIAALRDGGFIGGR
jgi:hypothetical protein